MFSYLFTIDEFLEHCETISYITENKVIKPIENASSYDDCKRCEVSNHSDCNDQCPHMPYLVAWLVDRVADANWGKAGDGIGGLGSTEIYAWCRSVCVYMYRIIKAIKGAQITDPGKIAIGLEYYLEADKKGRSDVILAGFGENNEKNIIIVELKQYSNIAGIEIDEKNDIKWTYDFNRSKHTVLSPAQQVREYCRAFNTSIDSSNDIDPIRFYPCVYLHNMNIDNLTKIDEKDEYFDLVDDGKALSDKQIGYDYEGIRLYVGNAPDPSIDDLNDYEKSFANYILSVIRKGTTNDHEEVRDARSIIDDLRHRTKALSVNELVDAMVWDGTGDNPYEKYLRSDQRALINQGSGNDCLKSHVDNNITCIDIVRGGPGSGKTFIAFLLFNYCINKGKNVVFCLRAASPQNVYTDTLLKMIIEAGKEQPEPVRSLIGTLRDKGNSFNRKKEKIRESVRNSECADSTLKRLLDIFCRMYYWSEILDSDERYDVIIFDEAQRFNGTSVDLKTVAQKGNLVVFLGDTYQIISDKEKVNPLIAGNFQGRIVNEYRLWSQFRCNQDEGYVTWLENKLNITYGNEGVEESAFSTPGCRPGMNIRLSDLDFKPEIISLTSRQELLGYINDRNFFVSAGPWMPPIAIRPRYGSPGPVSICINGRDEAFNINELNLSFHRQGITDNNQLFDIYDLFGLEHENVLVIIGKDVRFENDRIVIDRSEINDPAISGITDDKMIRIVKNIYRILMTRGTKKCYIYCMDNNLRDHLMR